MARIKMERGAAALERKAPCTEMWAERERNAAKKEEEKRWEENGKGAGERHAYRHTGAEFQVTLEETKTASATESEPQNHTAAENKGGGGREE